MSRYIDADALLSKGQFVVRMNDYGEYFVTVEEINKMPTIDAVPVVRCMECKYMRESADGLFKSGYFCERCHITSDMENCDDFYCADGERRTDEQQP